MWEYFFTGFWICQQIMRAWSRGQTTGHVRCKNEHVTRNGKMADSTGLSLSPLLYFFPFSNLFFVILTSFLMVYEYTSPPEPNTSPLSHHKNTLLDFWFLKYPDKPFLHQPRCRRIYVCVWVWVWGKKVRGRRDRKLTKIVGGKQEEVN